MNPWAILLSLCFFLPNAFAKEQHYLSICTIFQNEAPYFKEWIEYHRLMGVDHFYFYNNRSTDNFREILAPYLEQGIAELQDWPPVVADASKEQTRQEFQEYQPAAYNDCIKKCDTHWLAVIDVDEFIIPMRHPNLVSFLSQFDTDRTIGGVRINWMLYGTSRLPEIPSGKLLIESLLWRAAWDYRKNWMVKSIVRPSEVDRMLVHYAEYKNGCVSWPNENGRSQEPLQLDEIRINHYWTRAKDFFYTTKGYRLIKKHGDQYKEVMARDTFDLNQVYDPILLQIAPRLKEIVMKGS